MVDVPIFLDEKIEKYLTDLKGCFNEIDSIWLIGSRANNTENSESDWDFLVFANKDVLNSLQKEKKFYCKNIDLLIVDEHGDFKDPWRSKSGDTSSWRWKQESEYMATYRSTKFISGEHRNGYSEFEERWNKAIKVL